MRIFISSLGSRGDVQPYLALAVELKARGHTVLFSAPQRFRDFVASHGVEYAYMSDEFLDLMDTDLGKEVLENKRGVWTGIKATFLLYRSMKPLFLSLIADALEAVRGFEPDLIIAGSKGGIIEPVADLLDCPLIYAMPVMQMVPTREVPAIGFPDLGPGWYNRLSYSVVNFFMGLYLGWFNEFRKANGLPSKPGKYRMYQRVDGSFAPVLHCFSELLCPQPPDWPDFAKVSGFWFLDAPQAFEPPDELISFVEAGDPPIYIGFGSMKGRNPERTTRIILDAVRQIEARVILASGWGGISADQSIPENVLLVDEAPHDWLFPRVRAVIHHGGAGTTAAGLRAGKPTLFCPFFADQPFWGKRVHAVGAGPKPIPQKKLSVSTLVPAIELMLTDEKMAESAQALGNELDHEDGVGNSADYIESWMASQH